MDERDAGWWLGEEPDPAGMSWEERRDELAETFARAIGRLRGRWLGDGDADGEAGMADRCTRVALRLGEHRDWRPSELEASEGARPDGGVG